MKKTIIILSLLFLCSSIFADTKIESPNAIGYSDYYRYTRISWNKIRGSSGYNIYRSNSKNGKFKYIGKTTKVFYTDKTAKESITYYYKIKSYKKYRSKIKYSKYSNIVKSVRLKDSIPFKISLVGYNSIRLTINKLDNAKEYYIYRSTSKKGKYKIIGKVSSESFDENTGMYTDTNLITNKIYYYRIKVKYKNISDYSGYKYLKTNISNLKICMLDSESTYECKNELLLLGYSEEDVKIIINKFNNRDISKYLLAVKYNNLIDFMSSSYFNISAITRYQKYYDKNSNYKIDNIIIYVKMGIDKAFYSNIKKVDISKKELMLVNKYNVLSKKYIPKLTNISYSYGKGKLEPNAYNHFVSMCKNAKKDGIILKSISAYRSFSTQESIYNNYVKRDGKSKADTYSARKGHSEHQTGLAVDINTASSSTHFEKSKEYEWLINNSYKYGFILRYPKGKTFITGYKFEPWHFRYVGIEVATIIYENQITFDEYYAKYIK